MSKTFTVTVKPFAPGDSPIAVTDLSISGGDSTRAEFQMQNVTLDAIENIEVWLAVYEGTVLADCRRELVSLAAGETAVLRLETSHTGDNAKVFIWDENLSPLWRGDPN